MRVLCKAHMDTEVFNAEFESTPAFIPAEMENIVPTIEAAVKKYA